jgi:hypothetical protein
MKREAPKCEFKFAVYTLVQMLESFPYGEPSEPYLRALIFAVRDYNPSPAVLEAACRHIVRSCTFMPSVAELLRALREQEMTK